jgi:hypothetical protein
MWRDNTAKEWSQRLPTPYSGKLQEQNLQAHNTNWTTHHEDISWVQLQAFLTLAVDGGELSVSRPGRLHRQGKCPLPTEPTGTSVGLEASKKRNSSSLTLYRPSHPDSLL